VCVDHEVKVIGIGIALEPSKKMMPAAPQSKGKKKKKIKIMGPSNPTRKPEMRKLRLKKGVE